MEVVNRIATSMIYKRAHSNYLRNNIGNFLDLNLIIGLIKGFKFNLWFILGVNPDLYGPFWITLTLIFTIAISGNLANFMHHDHNSTYHWKYNFHLVSYAATCLILYVCLLPMVIWSVLKWSVNTSDESNPDLESVRHFSLKLFLLIKFLLF
jgi:hypothetical protein